MHLGAACQNEDLWVDELEKAKPYIQEINKDILGLLKKYTSTDPTGNNINLLYSDQIKHVKDNFNIYQIGYMIDRMTTLIDTTGIFDYYYYYYYYS